MYCPVCGSESTQGLNYCKRCGSNLAGPARSGEVASSNLKLIGMFLVPITCISLAGLILPMGIASELPGKGYSPGFIMALVILGIVATVVIDALLIRFLLHLIEMSRPGGRPVQFNPPAIVEHKAVQLNTAPTEAPSATEHTTRNFEPVEGREGFGDQFSRPGKKVTR